MKVRIGIDVGGTFTDAVAINNDTYELIGSVKVPTTHKEGISKGIVEALHRIMEDCRINPDDVIFIAHGTTQATNALLEGDVAHVGIISMGRGLEGRKARSDTDIGNIPLTGSKNLISQQVFIDTSATHDLTASIKNAVQVLKQQGAAAFVAAEAFSVDDPTNENLAIEVCTGMELPATATNNISKLYGLKIRTRTAVVNASIMPKMLEAATMTEQSIRNVNIKSPLMVMRCDGGVMTVDEVRERPILTILSGPAAGVAGALMYEKLTDGIFLEVGGTSTDISCVKDGKVKIQYAEIGGHKTYLNSLDIRTVGIGGGSMVQLKNGKAVDVGPRSTHIAGLKYEVYSKPEDIVEPKLISIHPMPGDPEYTCIECSNGARVALTLAGAANIAGYVKPEEYAYGNVEAARKAWQPLADNMDCSVEQAAEKVLAFSAAKNSKVVAQLIKDYDMDPRTTLFVGGGGGAASVVPNLAKIMNHKYRIAQQASIISTIGVALAMVRDMVERSITNPTDEDIISVRREAEMKAIKNGAAPGSVEINIEVDTQRNLVRAIAVGATELRSKNLLERKISKEELLRMVGENLDVSPSVLRISAQNGPMFAVQYERVESKLLGLVKKKTTPLRLIDEEGVIRLQKNNAWVRQSTAGTWQKDAAVLLEELTIYNDGGVNFPNLYVVLGKRIIDLSGLQSETQIYSLGNIELAGYPENEPVIVTAT